MGGEGAGGPDDPCHSLLQRSGQTTLRILRRFVQEAKYPKCAVLGRSQEHFPGNVSFYKLQVNLNMIHLQEEKIYVQHRVKEQSKLLWDLITKKNAFFYIAG